MDEKTKTARMLANAEKDISLREQDLASARQQLTAAQQRGASRSELNELFETQRKLLETLNEARSARADLRRRAR